MLAALVVVLAAALLLVPLGLPGTWVMIAAAFGYNALAGGAGGGAPIGTATLVGTALLAAAGEVLEFVVGARATRRYGGSRRAGWGAMLGGLVGAGVGVPVPVVGSVVGAFVGAFVGALVAEATTGGGGRGAARVAMGAVVGRALATVGKVGVGIVIAGWLVTAAAVR